MNETLDVLNTNNVWFWFICLLACDFVLFRSAVLFTFPFEMVVECEQKTLSRLCIVYSIVYQIIHYTLHVHKELCMLLVKKEVINKRFHLNVNEMMLTNDFIWGECSHGNLFFLKNYMYVCECLACKPKQINTYTKNMCSKWQFEHSNCFTAWTGILNNSIYFIIISIHLNNVTEY